MFFARNKIRRTRTLSCYGQENNMRKRSIAAIFLHLIVEDKNGTRLGYVIILGMLNPNHCYEILRINLSERNKGYGKKAMSLTLDYLFNHLQAHRVWLDVRERNHRAKHVYESLGFQVEGVLRECIKTDDNYESLILMGMLRTEYR